MGEYITGTLNVGGAEIAAFDPETLRLFSVNGAANTLDVINVTDPTAPERAGDPEGA